MSEEKRKVYRAHLGTGVNATDGHGTFCHYGFVTDCGRYVDGGSVMWPMSPDWCDSEAEALARLAPKIADIGATLIRQAAQLLDAGRTAEEVTL